MRKIWFSLVLLAAVVLSACSPAATPVAPVATTGAQEATLPANQVTPWATQDPNATSMECQVVGVDPTPGPTQESLFPSVSESDWVLGDNPNAALTVIEYSDFQ